MVTTNYDDHLATAANEVDVRDIDKFYAPAVPLGRSFEGIVHLHGSVLRPADELVLTDQDFGRAYLTDGWARRFVQDLFLNRTVLFVGYSHNDEVMKYLARGLPPETRRYALTDAPDDPKWNDLRIGVVEYPSDETHSALVAALNEWSARLEMGQLDHHARVREVVSGGPPRLPVEVDYLARAVETPAGVRAFANSARKVEWLDWAEEQPSFRTLFSSSSPISDESRELANWFCRSFVSAPSMSQRAIETVVRLGPVVCDALMQDLAWSAYELREKDPALSVKWAIIVTSALRTQAGDPSQTWHVFHQSAIRGADALPFLRRATTPRLILSERRPWYRSTETTESMMVETTVSWSASSSDITQLIDAAAQALPERAVELVELLEDALRDAHELVLAFNPEHPWSELAWRRSAIEAHPQDRYTDGPEYAILDGIRDAAEMIAGPHYWQRWLADEHVVFRRLGLHLLARDRSVDSDTKLAAMLNADVIFVAPLKHEVFQAIASLVPTLTESRRMDLLDRIMNGPPPLGLQEPTESELRQRAIFDILEWISRYEVDWPELADAIAQIRASCPNIGVRPHPDIDRWMDSGTWGGKPPFDRDVFAEMIATNGADAALLALFDLDYSERRFEDSTWDDAYGLIREVVETDESLGRLLLDSPLLEYALNRTDLVASVLRGWAEQPITDDKLERVLPWLGRFASEAALVSPIAEVCLACVKPDSETRAPTLLASLEDITIRLWANNIDSFAGPESDDWATLGLNTWPGYLAQFWLLRISMRLRDEADGWQGLAFREADVIQMMLETTEAGGNPAFGVLAGDLNFLFTADPAFATETLFPVFDPDLDERARHAWMSYLYNPRVYDAMFRAGFWTVLVKASGLQGTIRDRGFDRQYWRLVAYACLLSTAVGDEIVDVVGGIEKELGNSESIAPLVEELAAAVSELQTADSENAWHAWMATVMQRRVSASSASMAEKRAWGDLAFNMGDLAAEAIAIANAGPGPLGDRTDFGNLSDAQIQAHAALVSHAVALRMALTPEHDWHIDSELEQLAKRMRALNVDPEHIAKIAEGAMRMGYYHAATWVE